MSSVKRFQNNMRGENPYPENQSPLQHRISSTQPNPAFPWMACHFGTVVPSRSKQGQI